VLGWLGGVTALVGLSKIGGKKKEAPAPKPAGGDNGLADLFNGPGMEDLQDLRDAFGVAAADKPAVGNAHAAPLRLSIFAPPGGGKGTQCDNICSKYGVVHFSTGDALRAQVKQGTAIGKKAKGFMDAGALVPADTIHEVIKQTVDNDPTISTNGVIFDGVCRQSDNSEYVMANGLMPHLNIVLDVPDDEVVRRISGRRIDPVTNKSYHLVFAPPPRDIASRLVQRSDDNEEIVRERLVQYHSNKDGALAPYPPNTVVSVNGVGKPSEVWERVDNAIAGARAGVTAARTRAALGCDN
jgi:adenylate kinase